MSQPRRPYRRGSIQLPRVEFYNRNMLYFELATGVETDEWISPMKSRASIIKVQPIRIDTDEDSTIDTLELWMTPINSGTNSEQLDYLLSLDEGGDLEWDRRVDKSDAIIELTDGSKYREDIPMAKAKFIFDRVTPEQLYKLLYDPPTRLSWDKDSLLKYTEFDVVEQSSVSYYMINKAPWPMKNRDFVGQRHIHRSLDGSLQVYEHSIESELYPVTDAAERGETIFGGQIFRPLEDYKLQVVFISQVDVKGALPPKLVKDTLPMQLMKWKTSVEKAIKTLIH